MILDILETPINFIKENLTGWVLIVLIILIIYFIGLRNYYLQKERFYDQALYEQNAEEIEETEQNILAAEEKIHPNKKHTIHTQNDNSKKKLKTKKHSKKNKNIEGFEGAFEEQQQQQNTTPELLPKEQTNGQTNFISSYASTTLFDNLNLNTTQIQSCKMQYNDIIAQYIIDLGKLVQQQKKNRFLNTQKQYDLIIAKGVDKIINYLNNSIKSYNVITRTSIRTEVINTLTDVLELLIAKTNNDIAAQSNKLAIQNSTTIDYTTQLKEITQLRNQLEEYFDINKLLDNYSHKVNTSNKEINSILDKSFILPIYEQNYNKIQQLVNSDFNGDENNLADKYSKAYMDFLEQKKKEQLNINPLVLASQIESGLVSLITGTTTKTQEQYNNLTNPIHNPIPTQEKLLFDNTYMNSSNIIRDPGNRGAYLIDKSTQNTILEGFEDIKKPTEIPTNTNYNITKAIANNSTTNKAKDNTYKTDNVGIISNLMSGNFVQYIMNYINEKLNWFMQYYNSRMGNSNDGNSNNSGSGNDGSNSKFNLEENMIPAGFLLFVLSMLFYFIDITS
jgi:hypothetical protein